MGSALEVGKLVAASWLYHNWNSDIPRLLKTYLFGSNHSFNIHYINGYLWVLSKAHLDQVKPTSGNNIKIELIDNQINQQQLIIDRSQNTLDQIRQGVRSLYRKRICYSRGLKERKKQEEERTELNNAINKASDKIAELTNQKANLNLEQDKIEAEVGPIKYVAELIYGENAQDNFDKSVRIVILILIFVFDPLAVLLLIAANISLRQWRMKKILVKENRNQDLRKKIQKLEKRNKRLKGFKDITKGLGDNPDEIKVKLNEIMSINDRQDRNI